MPKPTTAAPVILPTVQTAKQPTVVRVARKQDYLRLEKVEVEDVRERFVETSGKTWYRIICRGVTNKEDGSPCVLAADKATWKGTVPTRGCCVTIEAKRSKKGPWWFLRLLTIVAAKPAEQIVPVKKKEYHPHQPTPTQSASWREKQERGLGEEQRKVYAAYASRPGGATRQQVVEITRLPINVVCARTNELLKTGLLIDTGKRVINPASGKWVEVLKVQDEPQQSLNRFLGGS